MVRPNDKAKAILDTIRFVAVATVGEDGQPWNSPVEVYHFPNDYILYWASWRDNQHSRNIRFNNKVLMAAFDSTPSDGKATAGVYILAKVTELTEQEEIMAAAAVFGDAPYNPSNGAEYYGEMPRRIYKATPLKIWMNNDGELDGHFIDIREPAEAKE